MHVWYKKLIKKRSFDLPVDFSLNLIVTIVQINSAEAEKYLE